MDERTNFDDIRDSLQGIQKTLGGILDALRGDEPMRIDDDRLYALRERLKTVAEYVIEDALNGNDTARRIHSHIMDADELMTEWYYGAIPRDNFVEVCAHLDAAIDLLLDYAENVAESLIMTRYWLERAPQCRFGTGPGTFLCVRVLKTPYNGEFFMNPAQFTRKPTQPGRNHRTKRKYFQFARQLPGQLFVNVLFCE